MRNIPEGANSRPWALQEGGATASLALPIIGRVEPVDATAGWAQLGLIPFGTRLVCLEHKRGAEQEQQTKENAQVWRQQSGIALFAALRSAIFLR